MPMIARVLDSEPVPGLSDYLDQGGGRGLDAARRLGAEGTVEEVLAAGLRGRGGAGFPTGRKWATVARHRSEVLASTVMVNASEGEPGSFKDRTLLRRNPFKVLEGALIAASAVGADGVIVAVRKSFGQEVDRLRAAIKEVSTAGWCEETTISVLEGPDEYLYGDETALLEVVNGRPPFPRLAPPFRHGVDEFGSDSAAPSEVTRATPGGDTAAPPALVNNAETMANVPGILADGPTWYRSVGTPDSPGTLVCTVSGYTKRSGVGEFPMGTPLAEVIEVLGGGPAGERVTAVLSGVANPFLPASRLGVELTYEAVEEAGGGLGAAGFIVFDETVDLLAVAQGVSRFLAVESCGQCTPCKQDGLAIAESLDEFRRGGGNAEALDQLSARIASVTDESRCFLAHQHQRVVGSLLSLFPEELGQEASVRRAKAPPPPVLIAPIVELTGGQTLLDERQATKQPDWTYSELDSAQSPVDRYADSDAGSG